MSLHRRGTQSTRERIYSLLSPTAQRNFDERTDVLQDLLNSLIHIPSYRSRIENVYTVRAPVDWIADETPYILNSQQALLTSVDGWFRQNLDGAGLDIDQAAFAFRLIEARETVATKFLTKQ